MVYQFTVNKAKYSQILHHLIACNNLFVPPLDHRVSLEEYAQRITTFAMRFEAWSKNELVGLVAVYNNDLASRTAFITNVSVVKEYSGRGIAKRLIKHCINENRKQTFDRVVLEVSKENVTAIALYTKLGFIFFEATSEGTIKLLLNLN